MQVGQMQGQMQGTASFAGGVVPTKGRYEQGIDSAILVQGGSLRSWSYLVCLSSMFLSVCCSTNCVCAVLAPLRRVKT